jgi:hypothetical protein
MNLFHEASTNDEEDHMISDDENGVIESVEEFTGFGLLEQLQEQSQMWR